jgi:uncharacterized circularly permuted ATP-grasp superfamily protein/uncharacterized alpha-E superfamily protein
MADRQAATAPHPEPAWLVRDYAPLPGVHDEMCAATGEPRPQWDYLIRSIEALGREDLGRRCVEARRLLHENGVTYNVYDDAQPQERLWPLDPIPVVVTSSEWSAIEQGLIQRAELLDAVLADLYGPRRLMQKGLLPPELIYAHPGFWRPCVGVRGTGHHQLTLYAADLARTPDGQVVVIGDRTQAPSGAGYALENRTVLSRVLPSLYRDSHVHRLAVYFRGLRAALHDLSPRRRDDPRVVLLTPGPENEAYFEHAYLANYLGYTLVQGGDLTVRDGRVWLMTLDGRMPVDVILRRVDDSYCDPLELRGDSLLGIPGLLQAARLGHVAIANPLGSSVLENPALMAFLPQLARELLNEDLKLPSATTWWCGDEAGRAFVLDNLERLVIKPFAPHPSSAIVVGATLTDAERQDLAARIAARPQWFVGQERVALSTAPVVAGGGLEPRPMVWRAFLAARTDGYIVMPGGLVRVSPGPERWVVSNQHGGVSKDVWVLASEPERQVSLLSETPPLAVTRAGDDVPGRVADDLFWLGRYAERADGSARVLREALLRVIAAGGAPPDATLRVVLRAVTTVTTTYPGFIGSGADGRLRAPERELASVLLDGARAGSVRFDLEALVRAGRSVRDRLSSDASRVINLLNRELRQPCELDGGLEGLQRVITLLAAFAGLSAESMSRGPAWRFLEIGRALERALHAVAVLRGIFIPALTVGSGVALEALLAMAHSLKTFRRRYRSRVHPVAVLDLLLLDEDNPRAVAHQLARLDGLVGALPSDVAPRRSVAQRLSLDMLTQVRLFDAATIGTAAEPENTVAHEAIGELLEQVTLLLTALSDELTQRYFRQAEAPQQLVGLAPAVGVVPALTGVGRNPGSLHSAHQH